MQWDLFCRVIDNFGDIGVCWRLAADLASRGESVRLWVDDPSALAWMAPQGAHGVTVTPWNDDAPDASPGDVVIEAFGCEPPPRFVERMAQRPVAPVWVNLEYLSAEAYVERSHRLRSPQRNGLTKWFFYPGFTAATGGLIREQGLMESLVRIDASNWLQAHGIDKQPHEQLVSLFCYDNQALPALIDHLTATPTCLLLAGAQAQRQVADLLGASLQRGLLRALPLTPLPQSGYDALLRCCDLNFVRGEDSFVRAQWAGRPFVWQIYPQHDDAHAAKLHAFLDTLLGDAEPALSDAIRRMFLSWNGLLPTGPLQLPPKASWQRQVESWRGRLLQQVDLGRKLIEFALERRDDAR